MARLLLSDVFETGGIPVGAMVDFPDKMPLEIKIKNQVYLRTGVTGPASKYPRVPSNLVSPAINILEIPSDINSSNVSHKRLSDIIIDGENIAVFFGIGVLSKMNHHSQLSQISPVSTYFLSKDSGQTFQLKNFPKSGYWTGAIKYNSKYYVFYREGQYTNSAFLYESSDLENWTLKNSNVLSSLSNTNLTVYSSFFWGANFILKLGRFSGSSGLEYLGELKNFSSVNGIDSYTHTGGMGTRTHDNNFLPVVKKGTFGVLRNSSSYPYYTFVDFVTQLNSGLQQSSYEYFNEGIMNAIKLEDNEYLIFSQSRKRDIRVKLTDHASVERKEFLKSPFSEIPSSQINNPNYPHIHYEGSIKTIFCIFRDILYISKDKGNSYFEVKLNQVVNPIEIRVIGNRLFVLEEKRLLLSKLGSYIDNFVAIPTAPGLAKYMRVN